MTSYLIVFILLVSNASILMTNSIYVVCLIWLSAVIGLFVEKSLRVHLVFVSLTALPMFILLYIVWKSAKMLPIEVEQYYNGSIILYALFLSLRICAFGGVLQWLFIPLLKKRQLNSFLDDVGFGDKVILAISSTLVLLDDVKRKFMLAIDARTARGLVGHHRIDKWKTFLSTITPVVYTSLISGIYRSDLWNHRQIDISLSYKNSSVRRKISVSSYFLLFWFFTIALIAYLGVLP